MYRIIGDVRQKLRALKFNLAFLDKMIDALFVNQIAPQKISNEERKS